MNIEFIERIKIKREFLEKTKTALKDKFIGIDEIIDTMSLWYLTP